MGGRGGRTRKWPVVRATLAALQQGRPPACSVPGASTRIARRRSSARNAPAPSARPVLPPRSVRRSEERGRKPQASADRGTGTADRHRRDPERHLQLPDRHPARVRGGAAGVPPVCATPSMPGSSRSRATGCASSLARARSPLRPSGAFPSARGTAAGRAVLDRQTIPRP